jgi:uncharacterized repeat protein (TIGR01451 family)
MTRSKARPVALAAALIAAFALVSPAGAGAATPAPAWKLGIVSAPTNLAPGSEGAPRYMIEATNVGGAPTSGQITLVDTLPEGLTPIRVAGVFLSGVSVSCEIAVRTVTCTGANSLEAGEGMLIDIRLAVDPLPDPTVLEDTATISGGGALPAQASTRTTISASQAPFDFLPGAEGLSLASIEADGAPATLAGSHPASAIPSLALPGVEGNHESATAIPAGGGGRDLRLDIPRGLIVDPSATPVRCTEAQFELQECPDASAVGIAGTALSLGGSIAFDQVPLYNLVPPPGKVAAFGFNPAHQGIFVHVFGGLRPGDYTLSASSNDILELFSSSFFGIQTQLWGDPSSPIHNGVRGRCLSNLGPPSCPVAQQKTPLLSMPSNCSEAPTIEAEADSWEEPGTFKKSSAQISDLEGNPLTVEGCNSLQFEPTIEAKPTTNLAESPSGLDFHLHQPQDMELETRSSAALKDISVALPQGMALNPAAAQGLEGCSSTQIGLASAIGKSPVRMNGDAPACPSASRIGSLEVKTPVLAEYDEKGEVELDPETAEPIPDPLEGSVYLAKPFDNPFGSLLAVYLTVEDEKTGLVAKVAAKITADPDTGQLVTRVEESPELPLEDVNVHLFSGARAPLITPQTCGTQTTSATATPWSAPEGKDVTLSDSFQTSASPGGGSCPVSPGSAPNSPAFTAGTIAPQAGAYSPFVLKLSREDGSQRLSGVDTTLPPGLIGKLAGVGKCSDVQLAGARSREVPNQGAVEQASPSCPSSSEIGTVDVSAGAGPTPLYVKAHAYLAGPYKGAPLSVAIITPAVAAPFDLGAVLTRVALYVNPESAQIHAVSDPFPRVLQGIPVDVRGASLRFDRPDFTLNPTSCDPMAITGNATTIPGQVAALKAPFQVGGCSTLGFKPSLDLKLIGGTKRGGHPALKGTYRARPGDANTKSLVVRLPHSAFLDQAHIRTICTRVQFAANACPAGSIYGQIEATTPLLEEPLSGPVYLRSSSHKLPDLVFDLHGVIDVQVATRIDSVHGGIRASIEDAPDAPLTKVVLHMQGQKKGLIVNSRDICKGTNRADVSIGAQNGKSLDIKPEMKVGCGGQRKGRGGHGKQRR